MRKSRILKVTQVLRQYYGYGWIYFRIIRAYLLENDAIRLDSITLFCVFNQIKMSGCLFFIPDQITEKWKI